MNVSSKRLDHYGIVAAVIKDIGLIELIDEQIGTDCKEKISTGEAVAGVIINGLAFASKPLMLTPDFFENIPLDLLLGKGITPEYFNRHKIGRTFDELHEFGCEKLFSSVSSAICVKEGIITKFAHADTTSCSLSGDYSEGVDENGNPLIERIEINNTNDKDAITEFAHADTTSCSSPGNYSEGVDENDNSIVEKNEIDHLKDKGSGKKVKIGHGHSKDKRPDLKQVVQELITSNDSGIPLMTKTFSGNASDSVILRERAKSLIDTFCKSGPRCLVADSKLFSEKSAPALDEINFITRVPRTLKAERECVINAIENPDDWAIISDKYKAQEFKVELYKIQDLRFIVVFSQEALKHSKVSLDKDSKKEKNALVAELALLGKKQFGCEADARAALTEKTKKLRYHAISNIVVEAIKIHKGDGKPLENESYEYAYRISGLIEFNNNNYEKALNERSCFVLATNTDPSELPPAEVLKNYKGQDLTEKGFAFLKGNEFFTSSLNLKKTGRIEALLMIMVLSLLVYTLAQRRLRKALAQANETIPNQIKKPVKNPTMRWVFHIFEGINLITIKINGTKNVLIDGLTDLRKKIINLLGKTTVKMYSLSPTEI